MDSTFIGDWEVGQYEIMKRRVKGMELFKKDILVFLVHLPNVGSEGHWALVVVKPPTKLISTYDSLDLSRMPEINKIFGFLVSYAQDVGYSFSAYLRVRKDNPSDCLRHLDNISCGTFICTFAEMVTRGVDPTQRKLQVRETHRIIAGILLRGRFDNEDFSMLEIAEGNR